MKKIFFLLLSLIIVSCSKNSNEETINTAIISQQWREIDAGFSHNVGINIDGTLWSWGTNSIGQLGDGTNVGKNTPTKISNDTNWKMISCAKNYTIALKNDGTLWAWGENQNGELGIGTNTFKNLPTQIGGSNWKSISAGNGHSLALKTNGTLWSWGNNFAGQLGDGSTVSKNSPIQVGTETNWVLISAGGSHSLATKSDGTLWSWGYNNNYQLGLNPITNINKNIPTKISTITNCQNISAGVSSSSIVKSDGTLWSWGSNNYGQLGIGSISILYKETPTKIGALTNWKNISVGNHVLAVKTDGTLWVWGNNSNIQLGSILPGQLESMPLKIGTSSDWKYLSTGLNHSIGIKNNGELWSWGNNASGELGDGTYVNRTEPKKI